MCLQMLAFIQSQPNIVERLLRHIETPSIVDLLSRIIQLDEIVPNSNVLEVRSLFILKRARVNCVPQWLSSENLMGRLLDLLSPHYTPSVHTVVTDLVKNIISMATPSPGAGITDGLQNGPASNRFARELATKEKRGKISELHAKRLFYGCLQNSHRGNGLRRGRWKSIISDIRILNLIRCAVDRRGH